MSALFSIFAPAKINLRLEVLRKRSDGYHDLRMIMLALELGDTLRFFRADSLSMTCDDPSLQCDASNLVIKSAKAFEAATGVKAALRIDLEKRTPTAAGLGGGSSDAAATLVALNEICGTGLGEGELERIGKGIGADVPFFIRTGHKTAEGIGEVLSEIDLSPELELALINPGYGVSTEEIFRKIQLTRQVKEHKLPPSLKGLTQVVCLLRNDLEPVAGKDYPEIVEIKDFLVNSGALGSLMSGSGPTVFGVFEDAHLAKRVLEKARSRGWKALATRTVAQWRDGRSGGTG